MNEVEHDIENYFRRGLCYLQSRRLRWITQAEALIILDIMRKPNSIIVFLYIQNSKSSTRGTDEHLIQNLPLMQILVENTFKLFCCLFVLMLSFSDSKVEICSVFNEPNRLKAILCTFQKYSVFAGFLASCRPCWGVGFDSVQ